MAFPARLYGESPRKSLPGEILLVIHDFQARSSDELSLRKGDRIELLEKDDDFGDGWYLGKLVSTGTNGLFPEVYTTVAPKTSTSSQLHTNGFSSTSAQIQAQASTSILAQNQTTPDVAPPPYLVAYDDEISPRTPNLGDDDRRPSYPSASPQPSNRSIAESARVAPLNTTQSPQRIASAPNAPYASQPIGSDAASQRSISLMMANSHHREDSPVIHETLNVIDEHITDMSTPRSSMVQRALDSGSEYSSHTGLRASYVHGDESDEDERIAFSEEEVSSWNSEEVSRYLESIGVDRRHCDVFREQEISGDILLGMDQSTLFMKEFDLGVVGRRLRTWHKIRAFQEQVRSKQDLHSRDGDFYNEPDFGGSQGSGARLPRIPSLVNRPGPGGQVGRRQSSPYRRSVARGESGSFSKPTGDSPVSARGPDSAYDRGGRRLSSIDAKGHLMPFALETTPPSTGVPHRKQPSLDRDWSLAAATAAVAPNDSPSAKPHDIGLQTPQSERRLSLDDKKLEDLDRGYMSGGELDTKKGRNVLRKRDAASASHSRHSSYRDDLGNLAVNKRHSRFGSAGSIRDAFANLTGPGRARSQNTKETLNLSTKMHNESSSPLVTKLDYPATGESSTLAPSIARTSGSTEKTPVGSPIITSPVLDSLTATSSPSRTTSAAASTKARSVDSQDSKSKGKVAAARPKHKTQTSAYTRGLRKFTPTEALQDCDYSGWMKKKSPGIMAIWRPRLFVLKGRRLSYFYSENDTEEKGLIDISNHRVLPAENEFLAGVHAAATRANASPTSPANATITTMNQIEVAEQAQKDPTSPKSPKVAQAENNIFIFKLVPPRAGLSRAVQFTKPAVHYFATDNVKQGRLWMAALMKATIDRDDSKPVTSTYQQKTISLAKAKAMRQRPPALMGVDEEIAKQEVEKDERAGSGSANAGTEDEQPPPLPVRVEASDISGGGLNIEGLDFKPGDRRPKVDDGNGQKRSQSPGHPSLRLVRSLSNGMAPSERKVERTLSGSSRISSRLPAAEENGGVRH